MFHNILVAVDGSADADAGVWRTRSTSPRASTPG